MLQENLSFVYLDDDPMSRQVIQILLKNVMGVNRLTIFDDNEHFIEKVKALPAVPDVIFLDIQMQPYDGFTILKMLRDSEEYRSAKIIALTASVTVDDVEKLRSAGFSGLMSKPIRQKAFPDFLQRILAGEQIWTVT